MLNSVVCRHEHFASEWYANFVGRLSLSRYFLSDQPNPRRPHRKAWEWCAIAQALTERGMLQPGRSGLGFAVGREPLPSFFASQGADILATDSPNSEEAEKWDVSNQHASSREILFLPELVDRATFDARVQFRALDMRKVGDLNHDEAFDFAWSSCSIEHLGGLYEGLNFVLQAMRAIKPGGIAVHTTELNVCSNDETLATGDTVLFRRQDIEQLDYMLRNIGCGLARADFFAGDGIADLDFDTPPYTHAEDKPHVKLQLGPYIATSMLLIVRKGSRTLP